MGSKNPLSAAMKPTSTPISMSPLIAWRPPTMMMPTVATAATNSTAGK